MPRVAVLLAAYEGENFIQQQLESIIKQENVDIDIFISIDNCKDRTLQICKDFNNPRIHIINTDRGFGCGAKNFYYLIKSISIENYDFISLADQDDIWHEQKIIRAIRCLEVHQAHGYSSNVTAFWPDGKEKLIVKSNSQKKYDYLFEAPGPGCTFVLTPFLVKKFQNFLQTPIALSFRHHDWLIYAFARINNIKWHIDSNSSMYYRQHDNNQVGANHGLKPKIKRLKLVAAGEFKNDVYHLLQIVSQLNNKNIDFEKNDLRKTIIKKPFEFRRNNIEAAVLFLFAVLGMI